MKMDIWEPGWGWGGVDSFLILFSGYPSAGAETLQKWTFEVYGGIEKDPDTTGLVRISISSYDSKNILDGEYLYDVQISKAGTVDTVITVDTGTITFNREITTRIAAL